MPKQKEKIISSELSAEKGALTQELRARPVVQGINRTWFWAVAGTCAVLVIIFVALFVRSQIRLSKIQHDLEQQQTDPTAKVREDNQKLVEQVGKLIVLPTDEEPTIATVSDLTKLKDQPFFAKAKLGDKVLIYNRAKKAILYRPGDNQIIELAPLVEGNSNLQTQ